MKKRLLVALSVLAVLTLILVWPSPQSVHAQIVGGSCSPAGSAAISPSGQGLICTQPPGGGSLAWRVPGFSQSPNLAPDGSSIAPAYSFTNNPSSGIYNLSGSVGFSWTNGTVTMGSGGAGMDLNNLGGNMRFYANGNSSQVVMRSPLQLGDGLSGGQITQAAASTTAGTCAMSAGTTCTITLVVHYNTGQCIASAQGVAAGPPAAACSVSTATPSVVTITASASNSLTWGAMAFGNPN